jgi:amino-acid N-acetyltransferase
MISYKLASEADLKAIYQLLMINNLPYSDIMDSHITFLVARDDVKIVGCIGLERYGNAGLLRSFAVHPHLQNQGIGKELYKSLVYFANRNNITTLHLLTNTASEYFRKIGFRQSNRDEAPEEIAGSTEFAGLCPVSSTYMILDTIS